MAALLKPACCATPADLKRTTSLAARDSMPARGQWPAKGGVAKERPLDANPQPLGAMNMFRAPSIARIFVHSDAGCACEKF